MPHPTEHVVVRHPETGTFEALNPAINYDPADPLVKSYPWAFASKPTAPPGEAVESVRIESATAAPGEKRSRRK